MSPLWAMVQATSFPGGESETRNELLRKMGHYRGTGVTPLLIGSVKATGEMNLSCVAQELKELNAFMTEYLRAAPGIQETAIYIPMAYKPLRQDALGEVAKAVAQKSSVLGMVFMNTTPGDDTTVYWQFDLLREGNGVKPLWAGLALHSAEADLFLALLGPDEAALKGYVQEQFQEMDGVRGVRLDCLSELQLIRGEREVLRAAAEVGKY